MKDPERDCLTERHLTLFGSIVHAFARDEAMIQTVLARLAGSDPASIAVMMRHRDFAHHRLALLDLMRVKGEPSDQWERVHAYLAVPAGLTPLRDAIAHASWVRASGPHSIQPNWILRVTPAIEPAHPGQAAPDEASYTLDDLGEIAANLADNHDRFAAYLREVGLLGG
ncbi:MAG: hypothetical protein ACLP8B_18270 [Xanthobacteraceae bacterium]